MQLFTYFSLPEISNTYVLGSQNTNEAILIDPGCFDINLLKIIEENGLYIKYILTTHNHEDHIKGLKTALKIYDAEIFSFNYTLMDYPANNVTDGQIIQVLGFDIEILSIPGHSNDSVVYAVDDLLFTGDVIHAGKIGSTINNYAKALLISNIKEKLFKYPDDTIIFPGHGPPTRIGTEKKYNIDIISDLELTE